MKKEEAERLAGDWFMGRVKPVPEGAKDKARKYCVTYGGCSEVIITAYVDFLLNKDMVRDAELDALCDIGPEEFLPYGKWLL